MRRSLQVIEILLAVYGALVLLAGAVYLVQDVVR